MPAEADRLPPYDGAAERAALGAMLLDPEAARLAAETLTPGDLHEPRHGKLFGALTEALTAGVPLDLVTARAELERRGILEACGGRDYLGELAEACLSYANVESYCAIIRRKADERRRWWAARRFVEAVDGGRDSTEAGAALALEMQGAGASWVDLRSQTAAVQLRNPETFRAKEFVSTAFPALNRALGGGFAAGESSCLFGPSAMGKSCFAANLALGVARQGVPAGIVSLEMCAADLWRLFVAADANVPRLHVRGQTYTDGEAEQVKRALARLEALPLFVVDRRAFPVDPAHPEAPTMAAVAAVLRDGAERHGWRVAFLDYLAKVGPFGEDDLQRIPRLTNWAFDTAQRIGLHLVCLSQTNKASWNRKGDNGERVISLEDAKGSIETIADFDNALGIVRNDWNTEQPLDHAPMKCVVLKARHAAGGPVSLMFHRATGRILETASEAGGRP